MLFRFSDLEYRGPYVRFDLQHGVVFAFFPIHPAGRTSWPRELRDGWHLYDQTIISAPPMMHKRKFRQRRTHRKGYAWNEYAFVGECAEDRHPDDPLHPSKLPFTDALCYDSPVAAEVTREFRSWLTERKNL